MVLDNHMTYGEPKDRSICACGGKYSAIMYCTEEGKRTTDCNCSICDIKNECNAEVRLKCGDCGSIVEMA